jgi:hypothetical protein
MIRPLTRADGWVSHTAAGCRFLLQTVSLPYSEPIIISIYLFYLYLVFHEPSIPAMQSVKLFYIYPKQWQHTVKEMTLSGRNMAFFINLSRRLLST